MTWPILRVEVESIGSKIVALQRLQVVNPRSMAQMICKVILFNLFEDVFDYNPALSALDLQHLLKDTRRFASSASADAYRKDGA